MAVWSS
ncbi:hypothetical protein HU200_057649 [Digitaria exilis]|nr:hypothetical protein HU200_057649 [Digitaria exilis]